MLTSDYIPYYDVRNLEIRKDSVPAATITSKGQITIPVQVRTALGLDAGDRIEFVELQKGQFAVIPATRSLKELKGMFRHKRKKRAVRVEEMNAAIARGASRSL